MTDDAVSISCEIVEVNYPCPVCGGPQFVMRFDDGSEEGPFCVECDRGSNR